MKNILRSLLFSCFMAFIVGACAVIDHSPPPTLDHQGTWAVLAIANHTETPQAGRRVEAITVSLLHSIGVGEVLQHPSTLGEDPTMSASENQVLQSAIEWAKGQHVRYAVTGSVDEWRYKVGVDGEPAVGVSLRLVDVETEKVVWSAVGGKTGWSREAVSAVAQKLINQLLEGIHTT